MDKKLYDTYQKIEMTHWWFVGRRQLIYQTLQKFLPVKERIKILDIGCNAGVLVQRLQQKGYNTYGYDFSSEAINYGRSRGIKNLKVSSLENMPYHNNEFDAIICLDLIEHIKDDQGALRMIDKVVRDNGLVIITVPVLKCLWGLQDEVAHHFRRYNKRELLFKIKENTNWQIEKTSYFNTFLFAPIFLFRKLANFFHWQRDSDFDINNKFINIILKLVFLFEIWLLKIFSFPLGVSLLVVARKK